MPDPNSRIAALEHLVAQYEDSLAAFSAINEELRTLPPSERLTEVLELNESTIASTQRLLEFARTRLAKERATERGLSAIDGFAGAVALPSPA